MYMYLYVDIMHIIINSYLDYQYINQHLSGIKMADTCTIAQYYMYTTIVGVVKEPYKLVINNHRLAILYIVYTRSIVLICHTCILIHHYSTVHI